jgi:hypothetical protein
MLRRRLAEEMKRGQTLIDAHYSTVASLKQAHSKIKDLEGLVRALKDRVRDP